MMRPKVFLSFGFWPEQRSLIDANRGAATSLFVGGMGACPLEAGRASTAIAACVATEVGQLRSTGFGFPVSTSRNQWVADVTAGGELRQRLAGRPYAALAARALFPLVRAHIGYAAADGQIQGIFTTWPVSGVGELRLGYSF